MNGPTFVQSGYKGEVEVRSGKVYLVGAGPGDPGLITVKGLKLLQQADVVIYDRLVDESILNETRSEAEKIYVGKASSHHTLEQEMINRLLIQKAREGKVVVRLKGGDPFVLGRGGEEAEALAEHGIPFEVVPGVSSAVAVPAYAGIPVTHRGIASSFTVVTGHKAYEKGESNIEWDKLSAGADTLVILMGIGNLVNLVDQLIKNDKPSSTPVAVITHGTTGRQRCVTGTLQDIVAKVKSENLQPPSIVVVGDVVRLRKHLKWFDK
jgi:uroporphyrinogen III methyltransferase / synthase